MLLRFSALVGFVLLLNACQTCVTAAEPRDDEEPPLLLHLESEGKKIPVEFDKPFPVDAFIGRKTAVLRVEPYRVFTRAGISFRYPREYTFAADLSDPDDLNWSLSGSECIIHINCFKGKADHNAMRKYIVRETMKLFLKYKMSQSETALKLGETTIKVEQINVRMVRAHIQHDVFSVVSGTDSVVLVVQDSLQEDGSPSKDRSRADQMLRESFRFPLKK